MVERPILFSGPMVRALLAGAKTQTRRVLNPERVSSPYGGTGDRLWVKETWAVPHDADTLKPSEVGRDAPIRYAADGKLGDWHVRTSLFMPRWASRITLELTDVRLERLQAIGAADAIREGVKHWALERFGEPQSSMDAVGTYRDIWETIHGAGSWAANPQVWVVTFRRC